MQYSIKTCYTFSKYCNDPNVVNCPNIVNDPNVVNDHTIVNLNSSNVVNDHTIVNLVQMLYMTKLLLIVQML